MKIGIDIDGVLADFNAAYMTKLVLVSGVDRFSPSPIITCWQYPTEQFGYSKEEDQKAWQMVLEDPEFWYNLPPYPYAKDLLTVLWGRVRKGDEVYFMTDRKGVRPKQQTEGWLEEYGFPTPTVLISADKVSLARGLGLAWYADDKPTTIKAFEEAGLPIVGVKQTWNDATTPGSVLAGIVRSL